MVQKTVLKVDISCQKCKKKVLKAVSGLPGVDKVEIDGAKGILSVTGDADPYEIIVKAKKAGKYAQVVSIGPPEKQGSAEKKKPDHDQKKPQEKKQTHHHISTAVPSFTCPICQTIPVIPLTSHWEEPTPQCSIL